MVGFTCQNILGIGLLTIFHPKVVSCAIEYHLLRLQSVFEFIASSGGLYIVTVLNYVCLSRISGPGFAYLLNMLPRIKE